MNSQPTTRPTRRSPSDTHAPRRSGRWRAPIRVIGMLVAVTLAWTAIGSTTPAAALDWRPGAKGGQIDLLFTADETRGLATRPEMAAIVCAGPVSAVASRLGALGAIVSGSVCLVQFPLWAAQAYYSGKRLGVTIQPVPWKPAYSWKY